MIYETTVDAREDKVHLTVAEFANPHELATRIARSKMTPDEALSLAAKLIHAASDVMEQELERIRA